MAKINVKNVPHYKYLLSDETLGLYDTYYAPYQGKRTLNGFFDSVTNMVTKAGGALVKSIADGKNITDVLSNTAKAVFDTGGKAVSKQIQQSVPNIDPANIRNQVQNIAKQVARDVVQKSMSYLNPQAIKNAMPLIVQELMRYGIQPRLNQYGTQVQGFYNPAGVLRGMIQDSGKSPSYLMKSIVRRNKNLRNLLGKRLNVNVTPQNVPNFPYLRVLEQVLNNPHTMLAIINFSSVYGEDEALDRHVDVQRATSKIREGKSPQKVLSLLGRTLGQFNMPAAATQFQIGPATTPSTDESGAEEDTATGSGDYDWTSESYTGAGDEGMPPDDDPLRVGPSDVGLGVRAAEQAAARSEEGEELAHLPGFPGRPKAKAFRKAKEWLVNNYDRLWNEIAKIYNVSMDLDTTENKTQWGREIVISDTYKELVRKLTDYGDVTGDDVKERWRIANEIAVRFFDTYNTYLNTFEEDLERFRERLGRERGIKRGYEKELGKAEAELKRLKEKRFGLEDPARIMDSAVNILDKSMTTAQDMSKMIDQIREGKSDQMLKDVKNIESIVSPLRREAQQKLEELKQKEEQPKELKAAADAIRASAISKVKQNDKTTIDKLARNLDSKKTEETVKQQQALLTQSELTQKNLRELEQKYQTLMEKYQNAIATRDQATINALERQNSKLTSKLVKAYGLLDQIKGQMYTFRNALQSVMKGMDKDSFKFKQLADIDKTFAEKLSLMDSLGIEVANPKAIDKIWELFTSNLANNPCYTEALAEQSKNMDLISDRDYKLDSLLTTSEKSKTPESYYDYPPQPRNQSGLSGKRLEPSIWFTPPKGLGMGNPIADIVAGMMSLVSKGKPRNKYLNGRLNNLGKPQLNQNDYPYLDILTRLVLAGNLLELAKDMIIDDVRKEPYVGTLSVLEHKYSEMKFRLSPLVNKYFVGETNNRGDIEINNSQILSTRNELIELIKNLNVFIRRLAWMGAGEQYNPRRRVS